MSTNAQPWDCTEMCPPVRNRYFYGKMLDVVHFELEQEYFNYKRWLLNRLVTGYGVVCGLGVQLVPGTQTTTVLSGVAIDKCGREIVVCAPSNPVTLPPPGSQGVMTRPPLVTNGPGAPTPNGPIIAPPPPGDCCDGNYIHLSICYHECPSDPVPALGGDCDTNGVCSPGSIREGYSIEIGQGKLMPAATTSRIQDVISGGQINYAALANYVTNPCPALPLECCIPLANIRIPDAGGSYDQSSIDVTCRPIVYTNDLLYELILAFTNQGQNQARGGKP
jgi:hypothetical protein